MADDRDMAQAKEAEADEQADLELADEDTELVKGGRKKKRGRRDYPRSRRESDPRGSSDSGVMGTNVGRQSRGQHGRKAP